MGGNAGALGIKLITLIPLVAAAILTFVTQNFAGAVVMVDTWTAVFAVITAAQVVASIVSVKASNQDQNLNRDFD